MHNQLIEKAFVSIPKDKLGQLPNASFEGCIHLVDKSELVDESVAALRKSDLIGFDTETRPSFKKGQSHIVSLLQLSSSTDCYLFRLNKIGMPDSLKALLEDAGILKIGLSIHDDFHNLRKLSDFEPGGFIDLQQYVKTFRIADNSLSRIYAILFGQRISKGQRLTNWEAESLTPAQQSYAALDAVACIRIWQHLNSGAFNPLLSPYLTFPEEEAVTGCAADPK